MRNSILTTDGQTDRRQVQVLSCASQLKMPFCYHFAVPSHIFRLTITTEIFMTDDMKLIDVNGYEHDLTKRQVRIMYMLGFSAFILSSIMNLCFYKVHPSAVDFRPKTFNEKCFIYVLGKKKQVPIPFISKGEKKGIKKTEKKKLKLKVSKMKICNYCDRWISKTL